MASVKKIVAIIAVLLLLAVVVLGSLALSDPLTDGGLKSGSYWTIPAT
jgi:hypothetical protein